MVNTFLDKVDVKMGEDILIHIDKNLENNHIDNLKFVKHTEENVELYNSYNFTKMPMLKEQRLPKQEKKEIIEINNDKYEKQDGQYPCILKIDNTNIHLGFCNTEEEVKILLENKTEELIKLISSV
jgi:hypothetical protein